MAFYNNRVSIAHVNETEIYLIRSNKNELILNYYSIMDDIVESIVSEEFLEEFDILINDDDSVYLIYQDIHNNLNLAILEGENKSIHKLTGENFPRIYELNILKQGKNLNIFFLYPINNSKDIFQIEHSILRDNKWESYLIDQIRVNQVLNPIKLIEKDESIFLAYYNSNQICLRSYSESDKWAEPIVLTGDQEKLYLDILYDNESFHLVYSEAVECNYVIKYKMYTSDATMIKKYDMDISGSSNCSNPTILKRDGSLWVIWNESSRIYSRYSKDMGKTWSDTISWDESIKHNILRYKYISDTNLKDDIINNTFGTIYPEIRFLGFY